MVDNFDITFMQKAIDTAWYYQGLTYPNPPVGAVIVDEDKNIISYGVHKEAGKAHAELDAVYNALKFYNKDIKEINPNILHKIIIQKYKNFFKNHTIYVTLEPCNHQGKTPPCSLLLKEMGFKRVVISILDSNKIATGGAEYLGKFTSVDIGILKEEGKKLISLFNIWQKKSPFIFFKVAVDKNFSYTGGVISDIKSRELVHKIRQKCDLLIIGGDSVRVDRPKLDTRLCGGDSPPDILILSRRRDFDKSIPLFNIKNRRVFIDSDFDKVAKDYKYIMIEGGANFYQLLKDKLDALLIFQSMKEIGGESFKFGNNMQRLKKFKYYNDIIEWKIAKRKINEDNFIW